jgi:hypothetical protein
MGDWFTSYHVYSEQHCLLSFHPSNQVYKAQYIAEKWSPTVCLDPQNDNQFKDTGFFYCLLYKALL